MRKKELETQKEFNKTIAEFAEQQKNANENFKGFMEKQYKFNKVYSEFLKKQDKFNKQVAKGLQELGQNLLKIDNLADKNGDYVRFLATTDKDEVRVTENQFTINIEYIKDGSLRYIGMGKDDYPDLRFFKVDKNERNYAILLFKDDKEKSVKSYKVDKNTEQVVDVTDLLPNKEAIEKVGKAINSTIDNLSSMFIDWLDNASKTAKNVKKDTEKPAKNVGKKATKKKESK